MNKEGELSKIEVRNIIRLFLQMSIGEFVFVFVFLFVCE